MLDLKILGGTIVDGSGAPRYCGDVGIKNGMIAAIGEVNGPARQTIHATGKIVAPGFVDVHTHYDAQVFWDPTLSPSSFHGVTTIFGGLCGFSIAPLTKESSAYMMPMLARVEGMPLESLQEGRPWDWTSFGDYLSQFEGTLAINAGFLAGHSTIRRYVMGPRAVGELATPEDLKKMKEVLRDSIRGGALGFSTTISPTHNDADGNPVPSRHASREELLELFSVVSEFEGTSAELLPGVDFTDETYEILTQVSLAAKRPVNWNVIAITDMRPEEMVEIQRKLGASDYARERGANVIALTMPQNAHIRINLFSGFFFDTIPGWAPFFALPVATRMEKLRDSAYVARLKADAATMTGTLSMVAKWPGLRIVEVFSQENKSFKGRLIGDIAAEQGRDPFEVFVSIALADQLKTNFVPELDEGDMPGIYSERAKLWADPRTVVGGSDAGAHLDMLDSFALPTALLAEGVREHGVISLEQGIHHLTQQPAQLMGLKNRGLIKQGWHADIVVFDADTIAMGQVHTREDLPGNGMRLYAEAEGIDHIIVNGRETIRHGKYLGTPAGQIIRPGKGTYTVPIPGANTRAAK
jgi:N-acyl-D-aspartate/D-glutamate deacylase